MYYSFCICIIYYIFKDVSPVLMINTADQTVFMNSKKDGEIVNLYNAIKNN